MILLWKKYDSKRDCFTDYCVVLHYTTILNFTYNNDIGLRDSESILNAEFNSGLHFSIKP